MDLAQMLLQKAPVPSEERPTSRLDAPRPHYDAQKIRAHNATRGDRGAHVGSTPRSQLVGTPRSQYPSPTNNQSRMGSTPRLRPLKDTSGDTNDTSTVPSKYHKETPNPEDAPRTFQAPPRGAPRHPPQAKGPAPTGRPGFGPAGGRPTTKSQRTANGRPGTQYLARQQGYLAQGHTTTRNAPTMNAPATRGRENVAKVSLNRQPTASGMRGKTPGQDTTGAQGWSGGRPEAWGFAMPKRGGQKKPSAEDGHAEGCRPTTRGRDAVQRLVTPGDF